MPQLIWNASDFLACLEVEPVVDEYETGYHYSVAKDGMRLLLAVFPYASDICVTISRDGLERPVINFTISNCSGTRYVNDSRGEFLEFAPSQVFGNRFQKDYVIPVAVRLSVKPSICVELIAKPT